MADHPGTVIEPSFGFSARLAVWFVLVLVVGEVLAVCEVARLPGLAQKRRGPEAAQAREARRT
eukprot:CAMPEP_0172617258 /NCGR_PEP_ID=MMETSP1068-20121228/70146_1 /TAXON_ID=35684 /ORGANISM="Pseudopedinella elastica, Strain CCMP716" /LENGTH=62 /DNA_ID=CAMNT_0013422985 /DNA_START=90 /DNA_END=274 /DNA_ORIENTATION=+